MVFSRPEGQSPLLVSFKSTPEVRALPSTGITRLRRYYGPLRLPPGPAPKVPLRVATPHPGRVSHVTQDTFLTCCPHYPGRSNRCIGYGPVPLRPSPNIGRVGIHNCPFGAFSGFTHVTACQVAAALAAYICPQSFSRRISPAHCLGSYRDEPTISRAGLPPAGILRPRGAPISCGLPQSKLFILTTLNRLLTY